MIYLKYTLTLMMEITQIIEFKLKMAQLKFKKLN